MTAYVFANNVSTTLAASASSSSTTLTLTSNTNLPSSIPSGSYFALTLLDSATRSVIEIVYATAVSGSNVTVLRGQEGTGAQNWSAGDYIYASDTAGILSSFAPIVGNPNQTYQVAPATTSVQAVPYAQMFQQITVTGTQTVSPGNTLRTVIYPNITENATIKINAGTFNGQSVMVLGAPNNNLVTIASSASSGSPYFVFPDSSSLNAWPIPIGYGSAVEMVYDGTNWHVRAIGQTIGQPATAGNQYITLTQANAAYAPATNTYVTAAELASYGYATESWVDSQGFATESWVDGQGFATESWVNSQGFVYLGQFSSSFGSHQVITQRPDGIIEQWFVASGSTGGAGVTTFTFDFPEAFPTGGYFAMVSWFSNVPVPGSCAWNGVISATQVQVNVDTDQAQTLQIAIHVIGH